MFRNGLIALAFVFVGCATRTKPSLIQAIQENKKATVVALLNAGADVNQRGAGGRTPLMLAAGYGQTDVVKALLDRGADVHAQMSDGSNALTTAVIGGLDCNGSTIRALLDRAPDLRLGGSERVVRAVAAAKIKGCAGFAALLGMKYP